jgi:putative protease
MNSPLEIVCPAGTPAALKAGIEAGADSVYLGFRDETNARNFPGLNFSRSELSDAVRFAHDRGRKVLVAINTYAAAGNMAPWFRAVDDAAACVADAIIVADIGVLEYALQHQPQLRRHLSVQASASTVEAIKFYQQEFGISRVVLPRVLTVEEIGALNKEINIETEVFIFGGLCPMAEGRCSLSSYITGISPNKEGVCSPASHVRYSEENGQMVSRLGGYIINAFKPGEAAGYPTLCKGRFITGGKASYLFEDPTSLNALELIPALMDAGVSAIKIEGRQRGKAYLTKLIPEIRSKVDAAAKGETVPSSGLEAITEGQRQTAGVYKKSWK